MPTTATAPPTSAGAEPLPVPSVDDARRAAAVLTEAGARKVILFGSVARGEQTPNSDIDLAVVVDDLDYDTRHKLRYALNRLASKAAGFDVNVLLSDFLEFNARVANVPTCIESTIATYGQVLIDLPTTPPEPCDKEMQASMTSDGEALDRFDDLCRAVNAAVALAANQRSLPDASLTHNDPYLRLLAGERLKQLGQLHLAIEAALKTLLALYGSTPPRTHETSDLENLLPEPHRSTAITIRGGLPHDDIERWHEEANYAGIGKYQLEWLDELVKSVAVTSLRLTEYAAASVAERPGGSPAAELARQLCADLSETLGIDTATAPIEPPDTGT